MMVFDIPRFEQLKTSADLPDFSRATCGLCGKDVEQVAMGFVEGEEVPLGGGIIAKNMDRIVVLVGPCGHSSVDSRGGHVYQVTFNVG